MDLSQLPDARWLTPQFLIALGASLVVALGVVAGLRPREDARTRGRLDRLHETSDGLPVAEPAFAGRSALDRAGDAALQGLPGPLRRRLGRLAERAATPLGADRILVISTAITVAGLAALAWIAANPDGMRSAAQAALLLAATAAPWIWLRRRAARRTTQIDAALPQTLDLIVTNIECGQGLQASLMTVADRAGGPIGVEIGRAMREIGAGVPREAALAAMGERSGSEELAGVARAIAQAERSGVSVAEILRARASELRERRRLLAREHANKVPVKMKMTIPTVLFIFPTFFLLVLGPVALNAADVMSR